MIEPNPEKGRSNLNILGETLEKEYEWLKSLIKHRIRTFDQAHRKNTRSEIEFKSFDFSSAPDLCANTDVYSKLCANLGWSNTDRIIILLVLATYVRQEVLDLLIDDKKISAVFSDFNKKKMTLDLIVFVLIGEDYKQKLSYMKLLNDDYPLFKDHILKRVLKTETNNSENDFDSVIDLTEEFRHQISTGEFYEPDYSASFPARKVTTHFSWKDLVLDKKVAGLVQIMANWVKNLDKIKSYASLSKGIQGYSAILYGPPGTGKSMTVKVMGKELGKVVYRIDLSQVVSKYVGETEKNLGRVFDLAKDKDWVLFFDEGDALFGKRSSSKSSQDRYANQEVSYLLQRMEEHQGVILLATNKMRNIDEAFLRRFQTQIYFPNPDESMRLVLWKKAYSDEFKLEHPKVLLSIARKYDVSPAQIINIKYHSIVKTLAAGKEKVSDTSLLEGLSLELQKNNKNL